MTKAEERLLGELRMALLNGRDDEEAILDILREGNYYVANGFICEVTHSEWMDWEDGEIFRWICYEDPEPEEEDNDDE